ncbi:hypothetical protein [Rhodoferax sp.]|uniref:hypothetical protein n=1 Tax=Rhodoferax sp. TaxID=50421 RepID=UPI002ACD9E6F|nr:hypothetical protein [Rhodoferax sp.]MDZ7919987.1 hypothetical protein [Rhodoferax sp.]
MTRTSPPQVAFSSGEIDPLLYRRFDYARFQTGLAKCKGFLPLAQGAFTRAPGTLYKGRTHGDGAGILVPFTFAVNDAVTLEFTDLRMRVWRYGALVMAGVLPYELVTPYPASALQSLQWVQSADVIYLTDGIHPVQKLSRFALDNWTIEDLSLTTGPFRVQNLDNTLTVQASGETGSITLTASAALFAANHVGSLMLLTPTDNTTVPLWTSNEPIAVNALRRFGRNVYRLSVGTNAGENPPIHEEGKTRVDNSTEWEFLTDDTGVVQIAAFTSATSVTATVIKRLPKGVVDSPTYRWSEGAWNARYGYPVAVEVYDQRLCLAATLTEPRTVWFSTVGDFADFTPGVDADSAFAYSIAGDATVNRILNLKRGRTGLHILALGEEYSTRSESRAQVIGPTTTVFSTNSSYGSHTARPIAPDGNPVFISRDRRRVVMMNYSFEADANRPVILSRASQHLGNDGFEQIVWQSSPEPMAWLRLTSGDLAAMSYDAAEEILGWATVPVAGGVVESLAITPNATGTEDELTLIVRRTVDGATVRMVETMASIYGVLNGGQSVSSACHLYASADLTFDPPQAILPVPHLTGEAVQVWTDVGEFGPVTVDDDGNVTLPFACGHAFVGLFDATHYVETLDIQAAAADGNTMGRPKRLHAKFGVAMHRTAQGYIQVVERDFGNRERLGDRRTLVQRSVAATLADQPASGVAQIPEPSGFAGELALRFYPYSGAPMTVTAIVPIVQEAGR